MQNSCQNSSNCLLPLKLSINKLQKLTKMNITITNWDFTFKKNGGIFVRHSPTCQKKSQFLVYIFSEDYPGYKSGRVRLTDRLHHPVHGYGRLRPSLAPGKHRREPRHVQVRDNWEGRGILWMGYFNLSSQTGQVCSLRGCLHVLPNNHWNCLWQAQGHL